MAAIRERAGRRTRVIRVAILGTGNIGHALAALLGARAAFEVVLWGRDVEKSAVAGIAACGEGGIYAVGAATTEPSLVRAVDGADVVISAVPAHVRHRLLKRIRGHLNSCILLLAWEGMGCFAESVEELGIRPQIAAGLQRSPILCRRREAYRSVEILGVRSRVVAAPVNPENLQQLEQVTRMVLPFPVKFVREYAYAALSPGNPMIHPARVYACAVQRTISPGARFYGDWDNYSSEVLLSLHRELAELRDALGLSARWLATLVDRSGPPSPRQVTREILAARTIRSIPLPVRVTSRGAQLDRAHRFFREDIGEGLRYIRGVARRNDVRLPMTEQICRRFQFPAGEAK